MRLDFLHVCEYALYDDKGRLGIIGIFDWIGASMVPAKHSRLFIVFSVSGFDGKKNLNIRVKDPSKTELFAKDLEIYIDKAKKDNHANVVVNVKNLALPQYGLYEIEIKLDNSILTDSSVHNLEVKKI